MTEKQSQRLWARITKQSEEEGGCWVWTGGVSGKGYPYVSIDGKTLLVSRYLYGLEKGTVSRNTFLVRSCEESLCVNPAHWQKVSRREWGRGLIGYLAPPFPCGEAHPRVRLTEGQVREIRSMKGVPQAELASYMGISTSQVSRILAGEQRVAKGKKGKV